MYDRIESAPRVTRHSRRNASCPLRGPAGHPLIRQDLGPRQDDAGEPSSKLALSASRAIADLVVPACCAAEGSLSDRVRIVAAAPTDAFFELLGRQRRAGFDPIRVVLLNALEDLRVFRLD